MKKLLKLLLISLIMWPVYAQSQEPSPRPFKDIQVQNTNAKEINNKSNTDQQTTAKSLIVVKALPTMPSDMQSKNKTNNTFKESFYDKLVGWSTVILAVVTSILAFYTYRLWSATKETAKRQLRAYVFVGLADGEKLRTDKTGYLTVSTGENVPPLSGERCPPEAGEVGDEAQISSNESCVAGRSNAMSECV